MNKTEKLLYEIEKKLPAGASLFYANNPSRLYIRIEKDGNIVIEEQLNNKLANYYLKGLLAALKTLAVQEE